MDKETGELKRRQGFDLYYHNLKYHAKNLITNPLFLAGSAIVFTAAAAVAVPFAKMKYDSYQSKKAAISYVHTDAFQTYTKTVMHVDGRITKTEGPVLSIKNKFKSTIENLVMQNNIDLPLEKPQKYAYQMLASQNPDPVAIMQNIRSDAIKAGYKENPARIGQAQNWLLRIHAQYYLQEERKNNPKIQPDDWQTQVIVYSNIAQNLGISPQELAPLLELDARLSKK